MSYGKIFASCFTGSMVGMGPDVFSVWCYVIAHAVDGQVELNPILIGAIIGCPSERVTAAIDRLCEPDPNSRNKEQEGRRLLREGQYAYRVVSHAIYRQMRNEEERRAYNRAKQRESRERRAEMSNESLTVNDMSAMSATVSHGQPKQKHKQMQKQGEGQQTAQAAPLLADAKPRPTPIRPVREINPGDLRSLGLKIANADDSETAKTTLALYGTEACTEALRMLAPANPRGVWVSAWVAWLRDPANKWILDPEDYERAGLPVPPELVGSKP